MHIGKAHILELILEDGASHVRISCPPNMVPSPGQYLLAGHESNAPLPVPLFYTDAAPQSGNIRQGRHFIAGGEIPGSWNPGTELRLRGPLGQGFRLPLSARRVGLVAYNVSPARLRGLIQPALKQDAAVVLVCNFSPDQLPDEVEVQPISAFQEIVEWADYLAFDVERGELNQVKERLGKLNQVAAGKETQALIYTPVPCGGAAECGVCAVTLKSGWKLACKEGPVFAWRELE